MLSAGHATGRSELTIDGNHWVYLSSEDDHGTTTHYRTINDFSGTNRIHFESSKSSDGKTWTVTQSGDEVHGAVKP